MLDISTSSAKKAPTLTKSVSTRISGLDIARAFAILGMVLVNFKVSMGAEDTGPEWLHMSVAIFDGRAAALFVVLAGIGASLASKKARESGEPLARRAAKIKLAKRALFLFVLGWLFFPIWPADILHFYGAYLAIGAVLLFVSGRSLWILIAAAMLTSLTFLITFDPLANWNLETLAYTGLGTPEGFLRNLFLDGFHPVFPWIAFYLFGMWLGRTDLKNIAWRKKLAIWAGVLVLLSEGLAWLGLGARGSDHSQFAVDSPRFLLSTDPLPPFPLYILAGSATAVLIILISIWLGEKLSSRITEPLVSTGQLAMTIYVLHVLVGMGILDAFGLLANQSLGWAVITSSVFSVLAIAFSYLWRRRFSKGPLEALMHRIIG